MGLNFADGGGAPRAKPAPKKKATVNQGLSAARNIPIAGNFARAAQAVQSYKPKPPPKPTPKPVAPRPQPVRSPAPAKKVASSSGGTVTPVTKPVQPAPPKPPAEPISEDAWLGQDTTWLDQNAAYKQALEDYLAQYNSELSKYGTEYNSAIDKVGLEREQGQQSLMDDYASRGMLQSGVYGQALTDYNTEMDTRLADMGRAKSAYESDLGTGKLNFEREQEQYLQKAKQDALNRRLDAIKL